MKMKKKLRFTIKISRPAVLALKRKRSRFMRLEQKAIKKQPLKPKLYKNFLVRHMPRFAHPDFTLAASLIFILLILTALKIYGEQRQVKQPRGEQVAGITTDNASATKNYISTIKNGVKVAAATGDFPGNSSPEFSVSRSQNVLSFLAAPIEKLTGNPKSLEKEFKISLTDNQGEKVDSELKITPDDGNDLQISIPPNSLPHPGKYTLLITDTRNNKSIEQDFTWGVLAINTNKSIYTPRETAELAIAVLDEQGQMVCDADLSLKIKHRESGTLRELSTKTGSIIVTDGCRIKEAIIHPDYAAEYRVNSVGVYDMTLTAVTGNGAYTISDAFEVRETVGFDIERTGPTRIYPPLKYPVIFTITPATDYRGEISENIGGRFRVEALTEEEIQNHTGKSARSPDGILVPLKVKELSDKTVLTWLVDWKAGETYSFGYGFNAPSKSPALYLLGPLSIGNFREARQWQIAADAVSTYNFVGINSPSSTHVARDFEVDVNDPTDPPTVDAIDTLTTNGATNGTPDLRTGIAGYASDAEAASAEYDLIESDGGGEWQITDPGAGDNAVFWAKFDVSESASTVTSIQVNLQGRQASATDKAWLGIWRPGAATPYWQMLEAAQFTTEHTYTGTISASISEYFDSNGDIHIIFFNEDVSESLYVDYVEVNLTLKDSYYGKVYTDETETEALASVSVCGVVDNGTPSCDTTDINGIFEINNVLEANSGQQLTFFIDGGTYFGNTVTVSDGGDIVSGDNLRIYQNHVVVRHETGTSINIDDMEQYDSSTGNDTDMLFDATDAGSDTLTVESNIELYVYNSMTFDPNGDVDTSGTGGLELAASATAYLDTATSTIAGTTTVGSGATLNLDASVNFGGSLTSTGTTQASAGTHTFTAGGTISGGGTINFYDLATSTTGTTTISSAVSTDSDVSVGSGTTLKVNADLTVNGGQLATVTDGIVTYDSGSPTVTIAGTGDIGVTSGSGEIKFYNLTTNGASGTTTLKQNITIAHALSVGTSHIFAMGTTSPTIGSNSISDSGDITMATSATSSHTSGTVTILGLSNAADWFGPGIFLAYNLTIGSGSVMSVDNEANDLALNVINNFTISSNATFYASSTATFNVNNSWNNSGIFEAGEGRVVMNANGSTSKILEGTMTGSSAFFNLTFNDDLGGIWTFNANATIDNDLTITDGTVSAPSSGTLTVKRNFTNSVGSSGFTHNNSTIVLGGSADTTQVIDGNTTFFNLTATTGDRMINFGSGDTFTIAASGLFSATGDSCSKLIAIRSTTKGSAFNITRTGAVTFSYVDVQDMNVSDTGGTVTIGHSVDSGGNDNTYMDFSTNRDCISASTDSSSTASGYSFQRKTFYDSLNSRHWTFNHDGDEIEVRYSSDGASWSNPSTAASGHLAYDTNDFSVWQWVDTTPDPDVSYVFLAISVPSSAGTNPYDIVVLRGELTGSNVTWANSIYASVALNGASSTDAYSYPYISLDSNNKLWVGAKHTTGSDKVYKATRSTAVATNGQTWDATYLWDTAAQLSNDQSASNNVFGNIVPLATGDMYATFTVGTDIIGCRYDEATDDRWETSDDLSACSPVSGGAGDTEDSGTRSTGGAVNISSTKLDSSTDRHIVQTSTGDLYAVIQSNDSGNPIEVHKSTDGTSWTEQDTNDSPVTNKTSTSVSAAIDSNDVIHIIYDTSATDVKYISFTTSDNNFGTEENVDAVNATIRNVNISIDTNDIPHVVITDSNASNNFNVLYNNRVGGGWKASSIVVENSSTNNFFRSVITLNEDDIAEIAYINTTASTLTAAVANSNNPTQTSDFTPQNVDTDVNNTGSTGLSTEGGPSIGIDSEGNTWIAYIDDTGADDSKTNDAIALAKHDDSAAWSSWNPLITTKTDVSYAPSLAVVGKSLIVFYDDESTDKRIAYDIYDSGTSSWKGETIFATPGTGIDFQFSTVRYSKYNFYAQHFLDVMYDSSDGSIYWNVLDTRPTKVDDASDFQILPGTGRQVLRTKLGDYYAFLNDGGNCEMWKSSDGVAWAQQQSGTTIICNAQYDIDAAIDGQANQDIHVVYYSSTDIVSYRNYDIATENWDSGIGEEDIDQTDDTITVDTLSIAVDSNNIPHIIYEGDDDPAESNSFIYYNNRIGGSWNASPITIESSITENFSYGSLTIDASNYPQVAYIDVTNKYLKARRGNGNDAANFNDVQTVDADVNFNPGQTGTSISVNTLTGDTWIAYIDDTGEDDSTSNDAITLAKHTGATWTSNWSTVTTKSDVGSEPSIAIAGSSDIYVFYENDTDDISYDVYDSDATSPAWSGETVLHTGTYQDVKAKGSFEWNNYGANRIDYLFSDATDVYWDYLYVRRSPTNIDNASNFGQLFGYSRQIIRNSIGDLYAILLYPAAPKLSMLKSSDQGNSWSSKDPLNGPGVAWSNARISAAIDSNDIIHFAYTVEDETSTDFDTKYKTFNTTTDTFGSTEDIDLSSASSIGEVALSIDLNDKPHVVYRDASQLSYTNKISGSWKSPVQVEAITTTSGIDLTISDENIPEISFLSIIAIDLVAKQGNANDASSFSTQTPDATITTTDADTSIGVDSSGNTWIAYVDSTTNYITLYKNTDGSTWETLGNWSQETNSKVGSEPSIAIDGTDIYVFYEDDQDDIVYDIYDSVGDSWSGETVLEMHGALQDVKARWSYINNYDSTGTARVQTNTYYFDGSDVVATDGDGYWTDETNADDGDITLDATSTQTSTTTTGELKIEGTNGTDQGTITSVKARVYGSETGTNTVINAAVYTDGGPATGTLLETPTKDGTEGWGSLTTLTAPGGSWDWTEVAALETYVYVTSDASPSVTMSKVEILVESTNTSAQNEIDYLYSDGTDVFYNRVALAGSTPGTQDTIATTTSGVAYSISAVSDAASPNDVHLVYLDESATKKVKYRRWDNNGASSAWQTAIILDETGSSTNLHVNLTMDTTTKDLYASWIDQTSDDNVYYRLCDVTTLTSECDTIGNWNVRTSEITVAGGVYNSWTANYSSAGRVFGIWTITATTPFAVTWTSILATSANTAPSAPTVLFVNETETGAQSGVADPVGVGDSTPAFSAQNVDVDDADYAVKYQILVYSDINCTVEVWNSGVNGQTLTACMEGNRCEDIEYADVTPLSLDGTKYYWQIKYWDDDSAAGTLSDCSDNLTILGPNDQLKHGNYFFNLTTERNYSW